MNEVIVSMNNISKSFPGVKALDHVKFELRSGEVMALLGENGAGKSTLMKILSGVYTRDEGTMEIFGKSYDDLTPKQAQEAGVAIIHQELNMCRHLTVTENMFLGREVKGGLSLNNAKMRKEAKRVLDDLRIDISPDQIVGDLPVSKQQMVEIAKALSIDARILIMDEPTSFPYHPKAEGRRKRNRIHFTQTGRTVPYRGQSYHHARWTIHNRR